MNSVSPRLAAIADWVIAGQPVADIGSDHAWLVIHLLSSGYCPRAIITDINPLPLRRAQSMIAKYGLLDRCDFRLGDGLSPLGTEEVATVCVAGMGGQTMLDMIRIAGAKLPSYQRLILQPMNVFSPLRNFLSQLGYPILRERAVKEGEACFVIMEVGTQIGDLGSLSALEAEVGPYILTHPTDYDNKYYLQQWLQKYDQRWHQMGQSLRPQVEKQRQDIFSARQRLEEVLTGC
ncbi:MAG: tRNA (adenine(22)-N(1))-methyltransferase [Methanomassiliicoccales archaeon]